MPAALMMMRCHLLGSVQASETLQYRAGDRHRSRAPISWTSPPKALQLRPWPNSWITLTTPRAIHRYMIVLKLKNSWYDGSRSRKVWKCVSTSHTADAMKMTDSTKNHVVKIQRTYGSILVSRRWGSKLGILM